VTLLLVENVMMTLMSINSRDICELELLGQAAAIGQEAMY